MRFDGKVVVVTGGGSGIGRHLAGRFASEGAAVIVADVVGNRAHATVEEIRSSAGNAIATQIDVTRWAEVDAMVTTAEQTFGAVDILVNNAAIARGAVFHRIGVEAWDRDVEVSLKGTFLCSRRVLPPMMDRRRGAIVNVASVSGLTALGDEAYSAAKAGIVNLTMNLAVMYGPYGVRVNAVAPGTVRTPIWQEVLEADPGLFERLSRWYPLGRVGEPEDVANAVMFLASDEAAWITGVVLPVDGGLLAGNRLMALDLRGELGDAGREGGGLP